MNKIVADFFSLGIFSWLGRLLRGWRGLLIATSLGVTEYGQYTVFLLFTVYCSVFDIGLMANLEREIPHYEGLEEADQKQKAIDVGWSTYSIMAVLESLLLFFLICIIYHKIYLAFILGLYLLAEKVYRAYDGNSRINLSYTKNGISQFIQAVVSLIFVWLLIFRYGYYGAFIGFIIGFLVTSYYLHFTNAIRFSFILRFKDVLNFLKRSFLLNTMLLSMNFYHTISLTVLAVLVDKETLGYFAFAYKISEICIAAFPYLARQVMRSRMYIAAAQSKGKTHLKDFVYPMMIYCWATAVFWVLIYWLTDWVIIRFAPVYANSIIIIKILMLALLPLGIMKIGSDYLCSLVHQRTKVVTFYWVLGILIQGIAIYSFVPHGNKLFYEISFIYVFTTFFLYFLIGEEFFKKEYGFFRSAILLFRFLVPLIAGLGSVVLVRGYYHGMVFYDLFKCIIPILLSLLITVLIGKLFEKLIRLIIPLS